MDWSLVVLVVVLVSKLLCVFQMTTGPSLPLSRGGHSHGLYSHNYDRSWLAVNGQSRSKGCSQWSMYAP